MSRLTSDVGVLRLADGPSAGPAASGAVRLDVRRDLGGCIRSVGVREPLHEGGLGQGVLLGADLLHDVHREQAAELRRTLEAQAPGQRSKETCAERVADTSGLDLLDLRYGGHGDRLLACTVDPHTS